MVMPLLEQLKRKFGANPNDCPFERDLKKAVLTNPQTRYTDPIQLAFLEDVTALDPRVKHTTSQETWERIIAQAASSAELVVSIKYKL